MNDTVGFVGGFREAAPYIHYLRGKTLVVGISDSLLSGETLLHSAASMSLRKMPEACLAYWRTVSSVMRRWLWYCGSIPCACAIALIWVREP